MKGIYVIMVVMTAAGVLAGCGGAAPAPGSEQVGEAEVSGTGYSSAVLGTSYEGALPVSSQLTLGILRLEGTANAVTPEQAKALLPLWRAQQAGALQSDTEANAVLKQIEGVMTPEQLAAIGAMHLTVADQGDWARQQGVDLGPPPEAMASGQAAGGGAGPFADLSEEERASLRATREAGGGGGFGPPGSGDLSEEERASMRATAEAGGVPSGARRPGGLGGGGPDMVVGPLVELLARRAAE